MGYNKNTELFEELRGISKKYGVSFWTAQQPQREFSGRTIRIEIPQHIGKSRCIGFFPMDHVDLIK